MDSVRDIRDMARCELECELGRLKLNIKRCEGLLNNYYMYGDDYFAEWQLEHMRGKWVDRSDAIQEVLKLKGGEDG